MASRFRLARLQAVSSTRSVGLVFDLVGGRWTFRLCTDGNGNGLRRAELMTRQDGCQEGPYDLAAMFPGMAIDVDPRLPGPEGDPSTRDPVRFGSSDILSFSAAGTCTAGTLFSGRRTGRNTVFASAHSAHADSSLRNWPAPVGVRVTSQRVRLGRDVRVVSEHTDGLELEGAARLAPGRPIDVLLTPAGAAAPPIIKEAMLCSWNLVRVGSGGLMFRGFCRWS